MIQKKSESKELEELAILEIIAKREIVFDFDEETQRKIEEFRLLLNSTTNVDCKTLFTIVD